MYIIILYILWYVYTHIYIYIYIYIYMVYRSKIYMSNKKAHCLLLNRTHLERQESCRLVVSWVPNTVELVELRLDAVGFSPVAHPDDVAVREETRAVEAILRSGQLFPQKRRNRIFAAGGLRAVKLWNLQGELSEAMRSHAAGRLRRIFWRDIILILWQDLREEQTRLAWKILKPESSLSKSVKPCKDVSLRGSAWSGGSISGWISQMTQWFSKCVHWIFLVSVCHCLVSVSDGSTAHFECIDSICSCCPLMEELWEMWPFALKHGRAWALSRKCADMIDMTECVSMSPHVERWYQKPGASLQVWTPGALRCSMWTLHQLELRRGLGICIEWKDLYYIVNICH